MEGAISPKEKLFGPTGRLAVTIRILLAVVIGISTPLSSISIAYSASARTPDGVDLGLAEELAAEPEIYYPPYHERLYSPAYGTPYQGDGPEIPSRRSEAPIAFEVSADPSVLAADGKVNVTVTVTNNLAQAISGLQYADALEAGMQFVESDEAALVYDSRANQVKAEISELAAGQTRSFNYLLLVTASPRAGRTDGEIWLHATQLSIASENTTLKAEVVFWIGRAQESASTAIDRVPPEGGWVESDTAALFFPEDAVRNEAIVKITRLPEGRPGPELQFELELLAATGLAVREGEIAESQRIEVGDEVEARFDEKVILNVDFTPVIDLSEIPGGMEPYVATYDPVNDIWVKVPIVEIDYETNRVSVATDHFSTWGGGIGSSLPQNGASVLLFDQPYTSLFTGGAQYSIPIWTPPGRAGMAPDIALSYSSKTIDGVLGDVQAPWVGVGWNIDGVEIVRKITTSSTGYGYENKFALTFNGQEHILISDSNNPARYYTERASFLYIERHNLALGNAQGVDNETKEWWEIVATDGTRYRLGWNVDSEQTTLMYGYKCTTGNPCTTPDAPYSALGYAGVAQNIVASRWRVDRIMDTHGNTIQYSYIEEQPDPLSLIPPFDRASYLASIQYTGFDDPNGSGDLEPGYEVRFSLANRSAIGDGRPEEFSIWDHYDEQYLDKIEVFCLACAGLATTPVRTITFDYEARPVPNTQGTLALVSLEFSGGGYSENGVSIPAAQSATFQFAYADMDNRDVSGTSNDPFPYPRLISIENGHGGNQTFTYEHDERGTNSWYNYRVEQVVVEDGVGSGNEARAVVQGYSYTNTTYTDEGGTGLGELIGYGKVTATTYQLDGVTKILDVAHTFGTLGLDIGRGLQSEWKDPSNGTVQQKTVNIYVTDDSQAPFSGWHYRYLSRTESYHRVGSSLSLIGKTIYTRDPGTGNLEAQQEYLGNVLYRKQFFEYNLNPDPAVHILDRVSRSVVTNASNQTFADVRYFYDGAATPPSVGDLTFSQTLSGVGTATSDAGFQYDEYGNLAATCAYTNIGAAGTLRGYNCAGHQESATSYDATLSTYPVAIENALGHESTISYFSTLGQPHTITDPNSQVTETRYDGLGRIVESYAPGFTSSPSVKYTYPVPDGNGQVSAPYSVRLELLDTYPEVDVYRSVWGIYDGAGRLLQSQVYDGDSGKLLVSDTAFNAQGTVERQGVPREINGTGGVYTPPVWGNIPHTLSVYDLLGRVTQVTAPGGRVTQMQYDGLATTVNNPNDNKITRNVDALGRLTMVREYVGTGTLYATTRYNYDVADRLTQVIDADANVTTIQYDWLGRKTNMNDPDMGVWNYAYDALGNLVRQTDARGQRVCFYYDDLNRLTGKHYRSDDSCPASPSLDISYSYDATSGGLGIGRRTAMSDESGSTTWTYSNHGRSVTESKTIGSFTGTFVVHTDWLGRVLSMDYPDSETVTYSYDALGRAEGFSSDALTNINLAELAYNELGQIEEMALGVDTQTLASAVLIENTYDSQTFRLSRRTATSGAATHLDFSYYYDPVGNLVQINDDKLGEILTYAYDELDRLTEADIYAASLFTAGQRFAYDKIGNIQQVSDWEVDFLFRDDFESNDFSAWSSSVTDDGDLSTSTDAALLGSYGMSALIDDTNAIYVQHTLANSESRLRARFYFNPNSVSIGSEETFSIFTDGAQTMLVTVGYDSGNYRLRIEAQDDDTNWNYGEWQLITNDWHAIEIDWNAAGGPGSNDGAMALWIDGVEEDLLAGLDTDTIAVSSAALGPQQIGATVSGTVYFDAFESRTTTYIGLLPDPNPQAGLFESPQIGITGIRAALYGGSNQLPHAAFAQTPTPYPGVYARWRLDEGTGGTASDDSAYFNHGTLQNGAAWNSQGARNSAVSFDGNDDFIGVPSSDSLKPSGSFSVGAWVYPTASGSGNVRTILNKGGADRDYALWLDGEGYLVFHLEDLDPQEVSGPILPLNAWHYVVGVYDQGAGQIRLYVNGVLVSASNVSGSITHNDTQLTLSDATTAWQGSLDEITIHDHALSNAEVQAEWGMVATPTPTNTPTATPTEIPTATPTGPTPTPTSTPDLGPWLDPAWTFRRPITINHSGGTLTNYDVLIQLDSAALISSGRMLADCSDLRVTDADGTTLIAYWIEAGCNTSQTQVWARVPSIPDGGKTIYVYYTNWNATNAEQNWSGQFTLLADNACPSGWTRNTALDGRFPYGAASYGATGGASSHGHASVTVGTGNSGVFKSNTSGTTVARYTHSHSNISLSISTLSDLWPPYLDTVYCSRGELSIPAGMILLGESGATGWTLFSALNGRFPRGAETYGASGGTETHNHSRGGGTSGGPNATESSGGSGCQAASPGHTHSVGAGTTGTSSHVPPYRDVLFLQNDAQSYAPPDGIAIVDSLPPLGWERFTELDNYFPRGAATYGAIGGGITHSHTVSGSTSGGSSGTGVQCQSSQTGNNQVPSKNHSGTFNTNTNTASNLPPYLAVVFAQRKSPVAETSVGAEEPSWVTPPPYYTPTAFPSPTPTITPTPTATPTPTPTAVSPLISLIEGLVSYWELDEEAGLRYDSHGRNDLMDNNTVGQADGKIGGAADFVLANAERLSHPDNADLSTGDIDFTIAAWVYMNSKSSGIMEIVTKSDSATNREYELEYHLTSDQFRFEIMDSSGQFNAVNASSVNPDLNTWYFIAAWHDSVNNTINIQVNNGTIHTANTTRIPSDTNSPFTIGSKFTTPQEFWDGRIDEVGFWKRALSDEERAALYNDGAGLPYPFTITGGEPVEDFIFADGFNSGNLAAWSSAVIHAGDLAAAAQAKYWGAYGLAAQINDTNELYVQDDTPDGETRYHARFYLDPNGLAMGESEELDVFTGQSGSGEAFRVQLQFDGSEYLVRIGAATDAGGWVDGAWHTLDPGRNAIEVEWLASTAPGANNGLMRLWLNGAYFDAVYQVDNDARALDSVRLGAMGIDTGTSGTIHLEEFESRRLSYIGLLPDPGIADAEPPNEPGWVDREYSYASDQPHAVTDVDSLAGLDEYTYDASGNMVVRVEGVEWTQVFNTENRLSSVSNGTDTWTFVYDGDGNRVKQVNPDGSITLLLGGGIYTVEDAAGTPQVTKYYSIAGQRVALNGPEGLQFLLTDHLGSVVGVTDSAGQLLSEQRYMTFGEPRFAPGIAETDFGFTGQRDLAGVGLMDYNARFYVAGIGRFTQADTMVPQMFSPQSLNRYSYVGNNAINYIDPSGHALCANPEGSCTANYVQTTSAPNPLSSTAGAKRPRTCQIRPEACRKGGSQILNEISSAAGVTNPLSYLPTEETGPVQYGDWHIGTATIFDHHENRHVQGYIFDWTGARSGFVFDPLEVDWGSVVISTAGILGDIGYISGTPLGRGVWVASTALEGIQLGRDIEDVLGGEFNLVDLLLMTTDQTVDIGIDIGVLKPGEGAWVQGATLLRELSKGIDYLYVDPYDYLPSNMPEHYFIRIHE